MMRTMKMRAQSRPSDRRSKQLPRSRPNPYVLCNVPSRRALRGTEFCLSIRMNCNHIQRHIHPLCSRYRFDGLCALANGRAVNRSRITLGSALPFFRITIGASAGACLNHCHSQQLQINQRSILIALHIFKFFHIFRLRSYITPVFFRRCAPTDRPSHLHPPRPYFKMVSTNST